MFHFHTRFCSFLKLICVFCLFFWNDRRPGRRHTVLQKDSSNSCCWYKLILYYNILSTVYIFNLKTISASSSYFKNHVYFFIPYYWHNVVWLSVTLVSKMKKKLIFQSYFLSHFIFFTSSVFSFFTFIILSLSLSLGLLSLSRTEEKLNLDQSEWEDIHVVTGALKLFFRELPEPLVPFGFFTDIVETVSEWMSSSPPGRVER